MDDFTERTRAIRQQLTGYLARREHSRWELLRKLSEQGHDSNDAQAVLQRFVDNGIQSDARFAETFIRSKASKGQGPVRVLQELKRHQLDQQLIQTAMQEADIDWFELAKTVANKRFGGANQGDFKARQKQQRFLQYRGFDFEQIRYALTKT